MFVGKNWLTCKEAATILGYGTRQMLNIIKKGKISAERDESGQYFIDKSEFYRVYPDGKRRQSEAGSTKNSAEEIPKKLLEERIKHLEEMILEKNKVIELVKEQLYNFTQEKSKMLEAINGHTRLLEHHENKKSSGWWPFKGKHP
jgi:predicted site-specific integrase-resolvase